MFFIIETIVDYDTTSWVRGPHGGMDTYEDALKRLEDMKASKMYGGDLRVVSTEF